MTPTLSPQQREEVRKSLKAAIYAGLSEAGTGAYVGELDAWTDPDEPAISMTTLDGSFNLSVVADFAVAAALPAIIGAVWLEAAKVARGCGWGASNEGEAEACRALQSDIAESLEARALAEEAR